MEIEKRLKAELESINYPAAPWIDLSPNQYDVVIIGAGMAGLATAFALRRLGIANIQLFDSSEEGLEGPWETCARMPTLRSTKELLGPALEVPSLTLRAWYEAHFGIEKWQEFQKIPTHQWMEYLKWFRKVLELPVENKRTLKAIIPKEKGLSLTIDSETITTSKVVLATGRGGFGGSFFPSFINTLPKKAYGHANDFIDFRRLIGKRIGVIGGGASGFDAAAVALKQGAFNVDIILRRSQIPNVNKAASITYSGFTEGYYHLEDKKRWLFQVACVESGIPPPKEALERVKQYSNLAIRLETCIEEAKWSNEEIHLFTSKGSLIYDFLILATGFAIDGSQQRELSSFFDQILLWKDRQTIGNLRGPDWFYRSPYLGPHFQFLEKNPGSAPFLKDIYCFNYGATMSHGLLSSDIPGIGTGVWRLAHGIASDFFSEQWQHYYQMLLDFSSTIQSCQKQ